MKLTELQWKSLLRGIEQDRCVICVGPEFYSNPADGRSQSTRLGNYLRSKAQELGIRVRENGWYHLRERGDDGAAYEAVREFYEGEIRGKEALLEQLAQINNHMVLSFTPDRHLADTFKRLGYKHRADTYVRNAPDRNTEAPTKDTPLVYNLTGELDQRNSLVLTYNDFFDFIQSTFRGNSMSTLLKDTLLSANYYLFLGIPEDDWRMHIFLRVLRQHERGKNKYAPMPEANEQLQESWYEQYNIKLINEHIADFMAALHARCANAGLLRTTGADQVVTKTVVEKLHDFIADNLIVEALDHLLLELKGVGATGHSMMVAAVQLKGRAAGLKEKTMLGILSTEDMLVEEAQISHSLLELIQLFAQEAQAMGIRI